MDSESLQQIFSASPKNPSAEQSITRPYELQNKINRSALYSFTFIFIKIFFIFCENVNFVGLTSISVSKVFSSFLYGDFPICVSDRERVFLDACVTTLFGLFHDNSQVLKKFYFRKIWVNTFLIGVCSPDGCCENGLVLCAGVAYCDFGFSLTRGLGLCNSVAGKLFPFIWSCMISQFLGLIIHFG